MITIEAAEYELALKKLRSIADASLTIKEGKKIANKLAQFLTVVETLLDDRRSSLRQEDLTKTLEATRMLLSSNTAKEHSEYKAIAGEPPSLAVYMMSFFYGGPSTLQHNMQELYKEIIHTDKEYFTSLQTSLKKVSEEEITVENDDIAYPLKK